MRFIFLFLLLCCYHLQTKSQTVIIDSLSKLLTTHSQQDDYRAELLNTLAHKHIHINPKKAITYVDEVLVFSGKTKNEEHHRMVAYLWKGIAYQNLTNFSASTEYIKRSLSIATRLKSFEHIGTATATMGLPAMTQGNFPTALERFQEASVYYEKVNDPRELYMYNNMAVIFSQMKNFDKAKMYFQKVLEECIKKKDSARIATALLNIGTTLIDKSRHQESLEYLNSAEAIFTKINSTEFLSRIYGNKGVAFNKLLKQDSAIYYNQKAIEISDAIGNKRSTAVQKSNLGSIYTDLNHFTKAKPLLDAAYRTSIELNLIDLKRDVSQNLTNYFEKTNRLDSALFYYKQYVLLDDSIAGNEAQNKLTRLELQYDFDRKADSLRFKNELTAIELQQQVLLSQQQRQKLLLTEKDRQLQTLLSFQRLSALQNEQRENDERTRQLNIANKEKELQKTQIASLDKDNYLNKLRLRQQWFFSLASILLLGGLGSFFIYRYNLKQSGLQAEIAKEKAEFETKMSNMALTSLRSQMNPHFIFNCLNSIRLFAAKNDSLSATNYISKFSRLMRLVLENSKNERISLKQEIETLQLYVDMELMRFKNKLKYDIHFENGMDTEFIEVPPMIVQPYVENAIWHGLMHKEEGGKLEVDFSEEEETLIVKVKDNGIGRVKAAELKLKSTTHKSFAMNITNERLQLLNERYGTDASVAVKDLYENEKPAGTEVTIRIPIL